MEINGVKRLIGPQPMKAGKKKNQNEPLLAKRDMTE